MKTQNTTETSVAGREIGETAYSQMSDEGLMSAIQVDDSRALETLLERYRGLLKSVILRIVHDHASADDVMQDCLVDIWRHASQYSAAKGKPLGWLVTMGKRRAIDYLRRSVAYSRARDRMENAITVQDRLHGAAADCESADMSEILQEELIHLPTAQQQVLTLAFLKGLSQREVANITHSPLGTVKTRIQLGLRKMRSALRTHKVHSVQSD